jgi:hypothetical protein
MGWWSALPVMRTAPRSGISRADADRLLAGQPVSPGQPGVRRLLAAAAAPARPGELADEQASVSALLRAYRDSAGLEAPPATRRWRTALTRALAIKITAAGAALVLAGTAAAAHAGGLPDPVQQRAHELFAPFGVPAAGRHEPGHTARVPAPSTGPATATAADLVLLCRTWTGAREDSALGRAVDPAVRQALAAAAGGESSIS